MKFSFENLGPISHGDLELANLTVVCGMNNTGKTYLTYTIYGFLQNWRQFIQFQRGLSRTLSIPLEFDLVKLAENAVMYVNAGVDRYVTSIPGALV